jgi:hypothetical protein
MIAGGAAAHSDHGRGVAETFLAAARGNAPGMKSRMSRNSTSWPWILGWK